MKNYSKVLKFTISTNSGDGAYLCYEKVDEKISKYFKENDLDIHEYALDSSYASENNIPENMQPFESGERATFGSYECCMSIDNDLELTVEDENSNEIYCGSIPKANIKVDKIYSSSIKDMEKGTYAVGYEGLEDCYISGTLEINLEFDVKKFVIKYAHIDYEVGSRNSISSITYENQEIDWNIDSYEGTGDNCFDFVVIK